MVTYSFSRAAERVMTINIAATDLPSAANQSTYTASWTLPANFIVADVYVANVGGTVTSTGTLSTLGVTVGNAVAGAQYVASTDLKALAATATTTVAAALPGPSTTDSTVSISIIPTGAGGNWSTFSYAGAAATSATQFTVTIVYRQVLGDSMR